MPRRKSQLTGLWQALDEAAFGRERTLNLRESLPSAAEARARTEAWLRALQMTNAAEALVITGRGNQSAGGVGVIRQEVLAMLPALRRRGIVASWKEHSPGSLVIKLAPVSALLAAPKRRRSANEADARTESRGGLVGLDDETLQLLRRLAVHNLESLGIVETTQFVDQEMARVFSVLMAAIPDTTDREESLRVSIRKTIDETG